jgi:hypothetical protein
VKKYNLECINTHELEADTTTYPSKQSNSELTSNHPTRNPQSPGTIPHLPLPSLQHSHISCPGCNLPHPFPLSPSYPGLLIIGATPATRQITHPTPRILMSQNRDLHLRSRRLIRQSLFIPSESPEYDSENEGKEGHGAKDATHEGCYGNTP